jgi:ABC-2 type transport system permease protein
MLVAFQYALRDGLRFRRVFPWICLSLVSFALAMAWKSIARDATPTDRFVNTVNLLVFRLLPLAAAIYTTAVISQEIEQKTIVYLLTRPIQRWKLLLGRWLAAATTILTMSLISLIMARFGSGGAVEASFVSDVLAIALGALAYSSLFLFVTLILNRAVIFCVLFAFGWETSVPNLPTGMQNLSVLSHMQAIAQHPPSKVGSGKIFEMISGMMGMGKMTAGSSTFALLVFSAIMIGLSCFWFTTHEYIPREDAE